jgi:regulator of protease activity HflC (stomatin/prohibitin superfamily)
MLREPHPRMRVDEIATFRREINEKTLVEIDA